MGEREAPVVEERRWWICDLGHSSMMAPVSERCAVPTCSAVMFEYALVGSGVPGHGHGQDPVEVVRAYLNEQDTSTVHGMCYANAASEILGRLRSAGLLASPEGHGEREPGFIEADTGIAEGSPQPGRRE